ncbi:penicillin-binding protein [Cerasibacillus quisquiliarum]|uniref:Carboxypeptidase n=1 Tax=Cerasibacillus quisquiliarum TaxID=227865 RepID=A0A511V062_9BACI|nr:transglycosylase domain-containing protein [Cerasibacillus quisquiliarum]MBB5147354.1 penicillin-binding protein [Cerasibacillus quisquiliarum]GEN32286.1 carboxypeptidase [Cerasibacillus quisquiliarum]
MKKKQRLHEKIKSKWGDGKIQRSFRITYDVIWNIILFFIIIGFIGLFFGIGIGAGYFASLVKDEPVRSYESMKKEIYDYEETSKMYFANNVYMGDVRSDIHREEIALKNISEHLINAVIATEDEYFEEHKGVVPKAIIRAIVQEALNLETKTGGSTLTQQLIKNQLLTNEVSFERKAKEILLAMRLENFFEKDQILEAYLNVIPYGRNSSGRNIAGIETAAQGVFGIPAKKLNIPQAAYLAGIPQNPYLFTPYALGGELKDKKGLKPGINRMKIVLKRMHDLGYISDKEYKKALKYDIKKDFIKTKERSRERYPYVIKEVQKRATDILTVLLAEEDGYSEEDLKENIELKEKYKILAERDLKMKGYKIHSTIDKDIYDAFQKVAKNYPHYGPDVTVQAKNKESGKTESRVDPVQPGAILIENVTGKVIAFVGGRGFDIDEYNYATEVPRQNGSTMKPLLGYAPAIEQGVIQPGTPVADIPLRGSYNPSNYSNIYYGLVSAREALAHSYNVSAVQVYQKILPTNPVEKYLKKMGFSRISKADESIESIVLGGLTNGATVEENTSAFTTFSNQGQYKKSYIIEKITTKDGKVIYEHKVDPVKVFSPQTAYLTYDMMRDVVRSGTAAAIPSLLHQPGVDWAGKTGTTNDYMDAWFVGTNPNVTMGTWLGYKSRKSLNNCPSCYSYSQRNIRFWTALVNEATKINPELMAPKERMKQPEGITHRSICAISGMLPSKLCSKAGLTRSDLFNVKYVPTKVDDSLLSDGKGYYFNPQWIKRMNYDHLDDLSLLFPRKGNRELWERIGLTKGKYLNNETDSDKKSTDHNDSTDKKRSESKNTNEEHQQSNENEKTNKKTENEKQQPNKKKKINKEEKENKSKESKGDKKKSEPAKPKDEEKEKPKPPKEEKPKQPKEEDRDENAGKDKQDNQQD